MAEANYVPRLKRTYDDVIRPELIKEFGYKNALEVPTIEKVVLNMGVGETVADAEEDQRGGALSAGSPAPRGPSRLPWGHGRRAS